MGLLKCRGQEQKEEAGRTWHVIRQLTPCLAVWLRNVGDGNPTWWSPNKQESMKSRKNIFQFLPVRLVGSCWELFAGDEIPQQSNTDLLSVLSAGRQRSRCWWITFFWHLYILVGCSCINFLFFKGYPLHGVSVHWNTCQISPFLKASAFKYHHLLRHWMSEHQHAL